jgi:membrane protease YdiL (CAAX protease family)
LDPHREGEGLERPVAGREVELSSEAGSLFAEQPSVWRWVLVGPDGLRAGWGLLLWVVIYFLALSAGQAVVDGFHGLRHDVVATAVEARARLARPESIAAVGEREGLWALAMLAATWAMARIERRRFGAYGFGGRRRVAYFAMGFAWGLGFLVLLVGVLWKAGWLVFEGRRLWGAEAWAYGAAWVGGFLLVGLFEEGFLRGYVQSTLARGLGNLLGLMFDTGPKRGWGFWVAAGALSFVFGVGHGGNQGESPVGLWAAGLVGLIFCVTLWKTGSLWWALGFHAAWDWAQSFVFGVADSGTMVGTRLLGSHPVGRVLWSGGATGPEGSLLVLPVLAMVLGVVWGTLPGRAEAQGSGFRA